VIGSDKISTELDSLVRVANERSERFELDYQYNDDDDPNQFYRRSDHFNFARNGIPIAFFFTGVHDDYHRPTDTVDKIQFDRLARVGRLIYTLGWKVADFPRQFRKDGSSTVYQ
jgi:Zn-dependent M28 family amino/carboxypeptidase